MFTEGKRPEKKMEEVYNQKSKCWTVAKRRRQMKECPYLIISGRRQVNFLLLAKTIVSNSPVHCL